MILRATALLALVVSVLVLATLTVATAAPKQFGPFEVDTDQGDVIRLNGPIGGNSALDFRRSLAAAPQARLVILDSPGGIVADALLIADDVHSRRLSTLIPGSARCYSACAFIFLAGAERVADGSLGVHQMSSPVPDIGSAQVAISDIIDILNRVGTPVPVLTIMFRTSADDMHVFTREEIAEYGIERRGGSAAGSPSATGASESHVSVGTAPPIDVRLGSSPATAPIEPSDGEDADANDQLTAVVPALPGLSVVEEYARKPDRLAVYTGLDFFGADIGSERVADLVACASRCLERGGACKAFTFNANERIVRGPNCFLKSNKGAADGNVAAISGVLLSRAEPDPDPLNLAVIDPYQGLFEDMDFAGGDLSSRPYASATTAFGCRRACIDSDACMAFTFIRKKRECWLKNAIASTRAVEGMVSGFKDWKTFTPTKIIQLDR